MIINKIEKLAYKMSKVALIIISWDNVDYTD